MIHVTKNVPARVGGVDLSVLSTSSVSSGICPRPCGRGGFKPIKEGELIHWDRPRPCGRGGFKLLIGPDALRKDGVPARVGGVDLSYCPYGVLVWSPSPRPCGRGGFKQTLSLLYRRLGCPRPCGRGGFKL